MPHRLHAVVPTALLAVAMLGASDAAAAERFAKPGGSTAADCLTEATACALGKAIETTDAPAVYGGNVVTLLPGDYLPVDRQAGAQPFTPDRLQVKVGVVLRGKPGAAAPTYTVSGGGAFDTTARLNGSTMQHIVLRRTGTPNALAVEMTGSPAEFGNPERPAVLDRVIVEADTDAFGVHTSGVARVVNTLVKQTGGTAGEALTATAFPGQTPRIVNSTLLSTGTGMSVSYGINENTSATVDLVNTVVRGGVQDLGFGTTSDDPKGSVSLSVVTSAFRQGTVAIPPGQAIVGTGIEIDASHVDASGVAVAGSPLIDAGTTDALSGALDLAGSARVSGSKIDVGAFELQPSVVPSPTPAPTSTPTPAPVPTGTPAPIVGPGAGPESGPGTKPADTKKPTLSVIGSVKPLKRSKLSGKGGVELAAKVDEAATVVVELVVKSTKKGKTTEKVLGKATATTTAAGQAKLKLKIKASKLGKGSLKAALRFTATDAAANKTVVETKTTVK